MAAVQSRGRKNISSNFLWDHLKTLNFSRLIGEQIMIRKGPMSGLSEWYSEAIAIESR